LFQHRSPGEIAVSYNLYRTIRSNCHLLGIQYVDNGFMGTSIFEPYDDSLMILAHGIESFGETSRKVPEKEKQRILLFYD